jgi:hypothetical protein
MSTGPYYKDFMIVIYNHNDSMIVIYDRNDSVQFYKAMILVNLTLAWSVNYNHKLCYKLKRTLQS